jgi:hypothetical protein
MFQPPFYERLGLLTQSIRRITVEGARDKRPGRHGEYGGPSRRGLLGRFPPCRPGLASAVPCGTVVAKPSLPKINFALRRGRTLDSFSGHSGRRDLAASNEFPGRRAHDRHGPDADNKPNPQLRLFDSYVPLASLPGRPDWRSVCRNQFSLCCLCGETSEKRQCQTSPTQLDTSRNKTALGPRRGPEHLEAKTCH